MSWALAAIEKAAMERARRDFPFQELTVFGMSIKTIEALWVFAIETTGRDPIEFTPEELIERLRERRK